MSAIFAKGHAYHEENNQYRDSLQEDQRLLLFRLCHAVNREQELAAPMVISYLMGWDDIYRSHHYTVIYWASFMGALFKAFPVLRPTKSTHVRVQETSAESEESHEKTRHEEDEEAQAAEDGNDMISLELDSDGKIYSKSQVTDYRCHGTGLEKYHVLDFFVDTWENDIHGAYQTKAAHSSEDGEQEHSGDNAEENDDLSRHPGWPLSD
ncbi:hypothetical protein F5877DRAFT_85107 [Lentinula edodes]|nr:hypothetical protein F5877DRAFT_85107 [Lentinula edodes]